MNLEVNQKTKNWKDHIYMEDKELTSEERWVNQEIKEVIDNYGGNKRKGNHDSQNLWDEA